VNYDRTCSYLPAEQSEDRSSKGESHVIRFKVPSLFPAFKDLVNGSILQGRPTIVDPVILKSDGFPTYHLANVVDDRFMEITHVIRGAVGEPSREDKNFCLEMHVGMDIFNSPAYCNI
jgi:glutamyl-tRNA synthetase